MAGRALLISTTTSTIPAYFMNALSIPKNILDKIDKTNRNFSGTILITPENFTLLAGIKLLGLRNLVVLVFAI